MVKHVISRQFGDVDRFATSLLRHWAVVYMQELTEHVTALLIKSKSRNTPPRKGLRQRYICYAIVTFFVRKISGSTNLFVSSSIFTEYNFGVTTSLDDHFSRNFDYGHIFF